MRGTRAVIVRCLASALALTATATASAGEGPESLEGTLRALFEGSPAFRTLAAQTREADGAHLSSSGAFDTLATAAAVGTRALFSTSAGPLTNQGYEELAVHSSLGATLRENVTAQITGSMPVFSSLPLAATPDQRQITASLTIPLLKLGYDTPLAAEERATGLHASATAAYQRDEESALVSQIAAGYWSWVGRLEQVKLSRRLEALARDQLKDVEELIAHNAKAPVERFPSAAAAENASATRAEAEELMFDAEQALWQAIGLPGPATHANPTGQLPTVSSVPLDPAALAARAHRQATTRPVLAFLEREARAADARADGARTARRPDVNLIPQATAAQVESAAAAAASPTGYTSQTQLGYYGGVTLQFSMPLQNRAARGAYANAAAVVEERRLAALQQANAIGSRIEALSSALATLSRTYRERVNAAVQFEANYDAERAKFKFGNATGMDLVLAEEQYMSAALALVADRIAYAVTLSNYLHESGFLTSSVQARDVSSVVRQLTSPNL